MFAEQVISDQLDGDSCNCHRIWRILDTLNEYAAQLTRLPECREQCEAQHKDEWDQDELILTLYVAESVTAESITASLQDISAS